MANRKPKSKCELDFSRPWEFSDVVLLVEGNRFHVHRSILAMWSPVFSKMFTANFKEKTEQVIRLPEKNASEIREMLLVIYPKSAKQIDENNYCFLLNLAEEYMMEMLFEKCEKYLVNCLKWPRQSSVLCLDLLGIAQQYRLEDLQMVCIDKARKLSFWELKEGTMYSKLSLSNFQQIVEGLIQQLESEIQQLRREMVAVEDKVRKLQSKFTEVESSASNALKEFTKLASILVHRASRRAKQASWFPGYSSTESLEEKLEFISWADGCGDLYDPLENLRGTLLWIKESCSSVKDI